MGLFFYIHSVALIEDLPLEEEYKTLDEFYTAANNAYNQVGLNVNIILVYVRYFVHIIISAWD